MRAAPTPFYFGPAGAGLFGWLHAAPAGSESAFGLVICNPFGFEEVCAHRSLQLLASSAAAAGIPTLRFDAAGCGNAEGDEFEPDRLGAWVASVHEAIETLKSRTGLARVCLLGMRLGASVAALAAAQRDDVFGLIAIAPIVRGRDWVRELRMLDQAAATASAPGDLLESAGFVLTAQTVEALRTLDLRELPKAPAPRVLIVERDDLPGPRHWQEALTRLGIEPRTEAWAGYAAIMSNPQDAKPPQRIIDGVVAALVEWQSALGAAPAPRPTSDLHSDRSATSRVGMTPAIRERIVGIQANDAELFGVLTAPAADEIRGGTGKRIGILMLNSGSVHHIGPNRLWVTLARRWAARGASVLRIDLSGIGDSPAHAGAPENRVYSTEAARDIAAALAWFRQQGIEDCRLLGLCSGAFHALNAAVAGEPLSAALMINPLTYSWEDCVRLGSSLNEHEILELSKKYRRRVFTAATWQRLARGELDLKLIAGVISGRARDSAREWWAKGRRGVGMASTHGLRAALTAAARREVKLHFVFGEGASGHELMQRQAGEALDGLLAQSQLSIDLVPDSDHTFTRLAARARLIELLDTLVFARAEGASTEARRPATAPARQPAAAAGLRASANATTAALPTAASTSSISR
ncbi:MAG: alpha/beta hydrolase [Burkholderiales bacterium]